jgi:hypothetical protein
MRIRPSRFFLGSFSIKMSLLGGWEGRRVSMGLRSGSGANNEVDVHFSNDASYDSEAFIEDKSCPNACFDAILL